MKTITTFYLQNYLENTTNIDFAGILDRTCVVWTNYAKFETKQYLGMHSILSRTSFEPYIEVLSIIMRKEFVLGKCETAVSYAWPLLYSRLQYIFQQHVDPK